MAKKSDGKQQQDKKPKKNTGEVSELYVLLTALRDGVIFAADEDLNTVEDVQYRFKVVSRREDEKSERFFLGDDGAVDIRVGSVLIDSVSHDDILSDTEEVLEELKKGCIKGTLDFDTSKIEERYLLNSVSADSSSKTDIVLEIIDPLSGRSRSRSFSIKSFMGRRPTLLNSSQSTNFIYRIKGELSDEDIEEINSMMTAEKKPRVDVTGRIQRLYEKGCDLTFEKAQNSTFQGNLESVDSSLPRILGEMLLAVFRYGKRTIPESTEYVTELNPLQFGGSNRLYKIIICRLLMASFSGMVADEVWNGSSSNDIQGGYIVVKKDGSVVCYYLDDHSKFEEYLFSRTYFETGSAKRHKYAVVDRDKKGLYIKLNVAIRMKEEGSKKAVKKKEVQTTLD